MLVLKAEDVSGLVSGAVGDKKHFSFETTFNSRWIAYSLRKVLFGYLGCEKEMCRDRLSSAAVQVKKEKTQSDWQPERRKGLRAERKAESSGSN